MDLEYFDIHSHLHFKDFDSDREEVIAEMKKNKIATISVGVNFETSKREVEFSEKHENIWACVGVHPEDLNEGMNFDEEMKKLEELVVRSKTVAIGECGPDYFFRPGQHTEGEVKNIKENQAKLFEAQINLAIKMEKPLMIHVRPTDKINYDAYKDTREILEGHFKKYGDKLRGNVHFFVGNIEILRRFLEIGFTTSFAGVITFAHEYDEVVRFVPLDMLMSETDSPLVAPVPFRGKRNSPLYVPEIVKRMAEIRGESLDSLKTALVSNALRHFSIKPSVAS